MARNKQTQNPALPKVHLLADSEPRELLNAWSNLHGEESNSVNERGFRSPRPFRAPSSIFPYTARTSNASEPGHNCRKHVVVLPGYGKPKYQFPTVDEVVEMAIEFIKQLEQQEAELRRARRRARRASAQEVQGADDELPISHIIKGGVGKLPVHTRQGVISDPQSKAAPSPGPTLLIVAGGFAEIMNAGRFKAVIAEQFDGLKGAVNWARHHMGEEYQVVVESLQEHLDKLENIYAEALPRVMQYIGSQHPEVGEEELLQAAVSVLNRQLAEILYVLSIWTDSFAQQRDGMYEQLMYVVLALKQASHLYLTGDMSGLTTDTNITDKIKSRVFRMRDVFMARFSSQGPATIPGGRGPVGAHAIEVPHDESDIITLMLALYMHEFRHDYWWNVQGLPEEMTLAVRKAIRTAHAAGKYKFSSDKVKIAGQEFELIDLLVQIYAQTITETDADTAGGACLVGPAYQYCMVPVFAAFNTRGGNVFNVNSLLRSKSHFAIGEKGELAIEPHMPDYPRVYIVAECLKAMGFTKEAAEGITMADLAAGKPRPKFVTWLAEDPKLRKAGVKIQIPFADLIQPAADVINAILNTKLVCQGGTSTLDLVHWGQVQQDKADCLTEVLMRGESDIPEDFGDVFVTHVVAAEINALWKLCQNGERPLHAVMIVEPAARKMLDVVREKFQAAAAAAEAAAQAEQAAAQTERPAVGEPKPTNDDPKPAGDDKAA